MGLQLVVSPSYSTSVATGAVTLRSDSKVLSCPCGTFEVTVMIREEQGCFPRRGFVLPVWCQGPGGGHKSGLCRDAAVAPAVRGVLLSPCPVVRGGVRESLGRGSGDPGHGV